jgi:uncharacterized protein YbaR (Trm112 family)
MAIDPRLLEVLACPEDKGPLLYLQADGALYNPRLRRKYRVEDGVPVMLVEEAVTLSPADHEALMARAQALGLRPNFEA